jgi:hypothetical protein
MMHLMTPAALVLAAALFAPGLAGAQTKLAIPAANVSASGSDANLPGNANDGSLSTRWSADATSGAQWLQYNLGGCYKVAYANLAWYNGDSRKYNLALKISSDGSSWTDVFTGTNSGTSAALKPYAVGDRPAQAMCVCRARAATSTNGSAWRRWKYGPARSATCPTGTGLDPGKPPGVNFDLSGYRLQTLDGSLD